MCTISSVVFYTHTYEASTEISLDSSQLILVGGGGVHVCFILKQNRCFSLGGKEFLVGTHKIIFCEGCNHSMSNTFWGGFV